MPSAIAPDGTTMLVGHHGVRHRRARPTRPPPGAARPSPSRRAHPSWIGASLEVREMADHTLVADDGGLAAAWCGRPCRPGSTCERRCGSSPSSPRSTAPGHTVDSGADGDRADHDRVGVDVGQRVDVGHLIAERVDGHGRNLSCADDRPAVPLRRPAATVAQARSLATRERWGDVVVDRVRLAARRRGSRRRSPTSRPRTPGPRRSTAPLAPLREQLFDEIKSRMQETDLSVPWRKGRWWYFTRTEEGRSYAHPLPAARRRHRHGDGRRRAGVEQVLLDENARGRGPRVPLARRARRQPRREPARLRRRPRRRRASSSCGSAT